MAAGTGHRRIIRVVTLTLAAAILFAVLVLPNHPGTMALSAFGRFPLELPVLILTMIALRGRWVLPGLLASVLLVTVFLKFADYGMFSAYNRPFNPILDVFLIEAGTGLLRDSIGQTGVIFGWIGAILGMVAIFAVLFWALRRWGRVATSAGGRLVAGAGAAVFATLTVADAGQSLDWWDLGASPPGTAWTTRLVTSRAITVQATVADLVAFSAEAAADPYSGRADLFDLIGPRDVIVIFIESYGRASFDNPAYADTHLATLRTAQAAIGGAGLAMRSGWLTSPTAGGQSWLAHGTLASGLWTSDNGRYHAMLTSGRQTLFHLAAASGYRTAAVMPAITIPWPESSLMGFDQVFEASDMDYAGDDFGWVTMPDQYTLSAFPRLLGTDPRQDFIQIALISSHAPWTTITRMIDWDDVGDGTAFNDMAAEGPAPREVWSDRDITRDYYRQSIDYSLQAAFAFAARQGEAAPLILILGDHQPAGFVAQIDSADVPLHTIGPPEVIDRLEGWDWTPGLIPDGDLPPWRMDAFRDRFIAAFTTGGGA